MRGFLFSSLAAVHCQLAVRRDFENDVALADNWKTAH
jgi:hypothetical protein